MRALVLATLAVATTGCVHTNAAVLNPTLAYQKVCPDAVEVFTSPERVPSAYREIALLNSKGESGWTDEKGMLNSQRKKAAQLGANGLVLGETKEPNAGTKIIGALFGTGAERKGKAIAIWIPADSLRVKRACGGSGEGARIAADDELVHPQAFGAAAPAPAQATHESVPQPQSVPVRLVQPVASRSESMQPAPTPSPIAPPDAAVQPAAPDTSHLALWAGIPDGTRYIADPQTRRYFQVGCYKAVEVPRHFRYYYHTEAAAQADGYTFGDCAPPPESEPAPATDLRNARAIVPAEGEDWAKGIPPGVYYVADTRTGRYYRVTCNIIREIPPGSRSLYNTKQGAEGDGYVQGTTC